tara:strand:+ start:1579 stop:2346 length:768 start_codon:yes stop_codon:yes gene_type:complete
MRNINIVGIIPARLNSSRYPGKPLINIKGLPMIEHVRRRVSLCKKLKRVIVATCDKEIKQIVEGYGGEVIMTSKNHIMASDRVYEASKKINCTHIINIQGDEILVIPEDINNMIKYIYKNANQKFFNGISKINLQKELYNHDIVKCVVSKNNDIIFCSRNFKHHYYEKNFIPFKKILGILGYSKKGLEIYSKLKRTPYEKANSIDQSRIIESGYVLKGVNFKYGYLGINNKKEEKLVKKIMSYDKIQKHILRKII